MTTVTELKALYVKLGGDAADVATIQTDAEMIEKIKEVAIPAELPSVTSEDNGDVLTVVEGAWGKAEPSGGLPEVTSADEGDVLTVVEGVWSKGVKETPIIITATTRNNNSVNLSKKCSEIQSLLSNNKDVIIWDTSNKRIFRPYSYLGTTCNFFCFEVGGGKFNMYYGEVTNGNETYMNYSKVEVSSL